MIEALIDPDGCRPLKFALLVNDAPFSHQGAATALAFARASVARGHEVTQVFFYFDGVQNANRLSVAAADGIDMADEWAALARDHGVDLVVCGVAARRRGVREANLAPEFRLSGLGQLVEAMVVADRLVTFGG